MKRDLTQEWYEKAVRDAGFGPVEFMGYRSLTVKDRTINISEWNGGKRRRDRLAYLLRQKENFEAKVNKL